MKLYHHKTDGGAEYLCLAPVKGTGEGDLSKAVVRLDGGAELINPTLAHAPELLEMVYELYMNIDISTINQSKRSQEKWGNLSEKARALYAKATQ